MRTGATILSFPRKPKRPGDMTLAEAQVLDELARAIRWSVARCGPDWTMKAIQILTMDDRGAWRDRARKLFERDSDA